MKVVITGITGFVGSELAHKLLEKGHEVYGIIRHSTSRSLKPIEDIINDVVLLNADITDRFSVENALKQANPDAILHLAAFSPVRMSFEHPYECMRTNIDGTMNIAHSIMELNSSTRTIVASTAEVYGLQEKKPFVETMPLNPTSPYAVSKATIDRYINMLFKVYDFNGVILRCSNTFGRKYDKSFFTEYLIDNMLKNKEIEIGAPDSIRNYMYIDDHVNAYLLAMESKAAKGEVLNIGGDKGFTNLEWVTKIADLIGYDKSKIKVGNYPLGYPSRPLTSDQPYLVLDASKAKKVLGWKQTVSVEEGLKKTKEYFLTHN